MAQTKKQEEHKNKAKKGLLKESDLTRETENPKAVAEAEQQRLFWQKDIDSLLNQEFESLSDALYALVDKVIDRLPEEKSSESDTREFLFNILSIDPDIEDTIKRRVRIKK